jgi:purine-binding chemotaxis protein CheW
MSEYNVGKTALAALAAHRKWKDRLRQAIDSGRSEFQPSVLKSDNRCDLGKWLYAEVPPAEQQTAHYQTVKQVHAQFHLEAAKVLELALRGDKAEAQLGLGSGSPFADASAALRAELLAWSTEESHKRFSRETTVSAEKLQAILTARARALTQSAEVQTGESVPLVVFNLGNETYGIATDLVREVQPLGDITPVPCTPDLVVGVINIRGSIYSVIDIRSFFGVPKRELTETTKVILVHAAGLEVGILADDVKGATSVQVDEIQAPLAVQSTVKEEYIQGVTSDMLIILNLEVLLRDDRIIIHEEVG